MFTAIREVHLDKGFWNRGGGYEFNLTLVAALAALVDGGPGSPSVDEALGIHRTGPGWAVAAVAAGAAGSALAIEAGRRTPALAGDDVPARQRFSRELEPGAAGVEAAGVDA